MERPTVLICGKDELLHHKVKARLARHGFKVVQVQETSDVIKTFDRIKPDLIIIYSTRKNSEDKLKIVGNLRKIDRFVPIILSTRYSSEALAIAALRAGVNDYLKVPISSEELLLSAKKLLLSNSDNTPTNSTTSEIGGKIHQGKDRRLLHRIGKTIANYLSLFEIEKGRQRGIHHYEQADTKQVGRFQQQRNTRKDATAHRCFSSLTKLLATVHTDFSGPTREPVNTDYGDAQ